MRIGKEYLPEMLRKFNLIFQIIIRIGIGGKAAVISHVLFDLFDRHIRQSPLYGQVSAGLGRLHHDR